jgi:hypothetical protein
MGIRYAVVPAIASVIGRWGGSGTLLTLGVQDCYFDYPQLIAFLKKHNIPYGDVDPSQILRTTGFKNNLHSDTDPHPERPGFIHQKTLFQLFGFQPDQVLSMDYSAYEQCDFVWDLNEPVGGDLKGRFDVIYDGGTTEHVFSTKDALFNLVTMLKPGGLVIHNTPYDMPEHGFYNPNVTLYQDFYQQNGFQQVEYTLICIPNSARVRDHHCLYFAPDDYYCFLAPYYACMHFAAYRKGADNAPKSPLQSIYSRTPAAAGSDSHAKRRLAVRLIDRMLSVSESNFYFSTALQVWLTKRRGRKIVI